MAEVLEKLRPDRDLQCYFFRPSAIAALSATGPSGFTLSGTWRQQFDWAVIEWNRDNVFEHPALRSLPDGDLSGLTLSYDETRLNCIALNSDLYPTVDWPNLRVWADDGSGEKIYHIPLKNHATAIAGSYQSAMVQFQLSGTVTPNDYVGIAFLGEHYPYLMTAGDTLQFAIQNIADGVNAFSPTMKALANGTTITLTYVGAGQTLSNSTTGANGNRIGVYTYVSNSKTETWDALSKQLSGGISPSQWHISIPFASLADPALGAVPTRSVRKLRWTYSADLQPAAFVRSEFQVVVSNWTVTGTGRPYSIAGPGSRRIEDQAAGVRYLGTWAGAKGNFSGGTIHSTSTNQSSITCTYTSAQEHCLYLGTRLAGNGTPIAVSVDGQTLAGVNLNVPGEDVLIRKSLGQFPSGTHTVTVTHAGNNGTYFYFDFFELAVPTNTLPSASSEIKLALATDWDTDHSIALAPERTAWIINTLGFRGRVNHYVGALWFYELIRVGHQYASGTVTFTGTPDANLITQIILGRTDQPPSTQNVIEHLDLIGDTAETLAKAFELELNRGYTAIWARADRNQLTIYSRSMGADGNAITLAASASTANLSIQISGPTLAGGVDGDWRTDLQATPRLNRAVRDWSQSFFRALKGYGLDAVASFSMELQDADPAPDAGIVQRYPSQAPVHLTTPSYQTNFSPASISFWRQVYQDMAGVLANAGLIPYLQFGEVQWWYFPDDGSGMPFYDAYTTATFRSQYGRDLTLITTNTVDPATIPQEVAFLPALIGAFTSQVMSFVRSAYANCRFEVLYPVDVNATPLNRVVNYPAGDWTKDKLNCLKTESFTYTYNRNLDSSRTAIDAGATYGFPSSQRSHLVGISDSSTAWLKEARQAEARGFESVVLFALDQFCLIGYPIPLSRGLRRSVRLA
ncbi:MAG TPA: hypothetical protein VEV17_14735 [Bryobacteraceae bacterium]|nr:hypothetical protein [Bryobacteraceae bacterium]